MGECEARWNIAAALETYALNATNFLLLPKGMESDSVADFLEVARPSAAAQPGSDGSWRGTIWNSQLKTQEDFL
jgi:hypothetical protein